MRTPHFAAVVFLFWASIYAYAPVFSPYVRLDLGLPVSVVGLAAAAYGLTQFVLRIPVGVLSDRLQRRKPFILFGLAVSLLSSVLLVLSSSPLLIIAARGFAGIAASTWVVYAVYVHVAAGSKSTSAMGLIVAVMITGQLCATLAGGVAAELLGRTAVFPLAGVIAAAGLLCALLLRGDRPSPRSSNHDLQSTARERRDAAAPLTARPTVEKLLRIGRDRNLLSMSVLAALVQTVSRLAMFDFGPIRAAQLGATSLQLGLFSVAGLLPGALGAYFSGTYLSRRLGLRGTVLLGFGCMTVASALFPLVPSLLLLFVLQLMVGAGRGMTYPVLMSASLGTVPSAQHATAMGFFQSIYALGMFGGPAVAALVGSVGGLPAIFAFSAAVGVAALPLVWKAVPRAVVFHRG